MILYAPQINLIYREYVTMDESRLKKTMEQKDSKGGKFIREKKGLSLEWVKRSRMGDNLAREALYKHFKNPFFSMAYRYTLNSAVAEDLLQDIFIKIFSNLQRLDNDEAFQNWAYKIAVNTCLSYMRHKKFLLKKSISLYEVEEKIKDQNTQFDETMMQNSLEEAIQGLSLKFKSVLMLHDIQGFKHEEIAQILGCSVGTCKSQLFRARMKIRRELQKKKAI